MAYHVIETDNKGTKKQAKKLFIKEICNECEQRYECITHGYRMNVTERDKFVLIPKDKKQMQVECHHMQRRCEENNSKDRN